MQRDIFGLGRHVRYVAIGEGQDISTAERDALSGASDSGSDFYEELLVNPALITLASQRGELDCGGLRHVIVGYGNFNQIVIPLETGHLSVCVERDFDVERATREIAALLQVGKVAGRRLPTTIARKSPPSNEAIDLVMLADAFGAFLPSDEVEALSARRPKRPHTSATPFAVLCVDERARAAVRRRARTAGAQLRVGTASWSRSTRLRDRGEYGDTTATSPTRAIARRSERGWAADFPTPTDFKTPFTCANFRARAPGNANLSGYCNKQFERRIDAALGARGADADALWHGAYRCLARSAPAAPLVNRRGAVFVSERLGNHQHHPLFGVLLDQVWVR